MSGELYFGIPGLIGASIVLVILAVIVRYVTPGHARNALLMLIASAFTYGLGDGLARLAAATNDAPAALAWFTVRFFGIAMVPPAFLHLAGASSPLFARIWFRPVLALAYTASLVGILVRVGTGAMFNAVGVTDSMILAEPGIGFRVFGLYGIAVSAAAAAIFLWQSKAAPTVVSRAAARISAVAVLMPFSAATAFYFASNRGLSPSFDPVVPFLTASVALLAGLQFARELPATTLAAVRTIFASLPDGIIIADRRGLVTFSNPAATAMLEVAGPGLEGEPLKVAVSNSGLPADARQTLLDALQRVEAGEEPMATAVLELEGPPARALRAVVGFAQAGQTAPAARRGELTHDRFLFVALHEETDMRSRELMLTRANEVKDLFISMIGHDLKAPLNAISGYSELIALDAQHAPDGLAVYRYAQSILASARQIQLMMENARLFSRLVDPQDILRARESVDLPALVQKEAQNLKQAADRRGVAIEASVAPDADHITVFAAPIIRSVFQNLIDNAVKYTAEKTKVTLRIAREGGFALVEVQDQGPGVPPDKREAVFRRFTRLEQTRTKTEGLGLGLAIARQLVELHGGSIAVGERPDGKPGATFAVRLPLDAPKAAARGSR